LQEETDVSGTISVPIIRVLMVGPEMVQNPDDGARDGSRNVSFFLQPTNAAVCPRRFY
jgi:hypothetical protein